MQIWDIWYPNAAAQGLSFCRALIEETDVVLVHAAPDALRVEVRAEDGSLVASADQLRLDGPYYPMTRLRRVGTEILREDGWPSPDDAGTIVLLAGGEAGALRSWWNADDGSEWRWTVEFYNHR